MCVATDALPGIIYNTVTTAISAYGQFQRIRVERAQAEYNNEMLKQEAKKIEDEAGEKRQEGIEEARNKRIQAILKMGDEKSVAAAGNIAVTSDNLLNINNDNKLNAELDALTTLDKSKKAAEKYEDRAEVLRSKYALNKFSASKQYKSGLLSIGNYTANRAYGIYGGVSDAIKKYKDNNNL